MCFEFEFSSLKDHEKNIISLSSRFQETVPHPGWNGTLDARNNSKVCLQQGMGQEDCLVLNVYVPVVSEDLLTFLIIKNLDQTDLITTTIMGRRLCFSF